MVSIVMNACGEFVVSFHMEGVKVSTVLTKDQEVAIKEVIRRCLLMKYLHEGKVMSTTTKQEGV